MIKINETVCVSSFIVSKVLNDRFSLIIQTSYSGWKLPVWRNFLTILNLLCYILVLAYGVMFGVRLIYVVWIYIQTTEIRFSLIFSIGLNSVSSHQSLSWHRSIFSVILPFKAVFIYLSVSFTSFCDRNAIWKHSFFFPCGS